MALIEQENKEMQEKKEKFHASAITMEADETEAKRKYALAQSSLIETELQLKTVEKSTQQSDDIKEKVGKQKFEVEEKARLNSEAKEKEEVEIKTKFDVNEENKQKTEMNTIFNVAQKAYQDAAALVKSDEIELKSNQEKLHTMLTQPAMTPQRPLVLKSGKPIVPNTFVHLISFKVSPRGNKYHSP